MAGEKEAFLPTRPYNPDWMSKLGKDKWIRPLNNIAIPGSHDSFASNLDISGPISDDCPKIIRVLCEIFGIRVKKIVDRWSVTQSLTVTQQLEAGIRYFDIRVSTKPQSNNLYAVHGLFSSCIADDLREINTFLNEHQKEVVLLDFNHFYRMEKEDHEQLLSHIKDIFGTKLCSPRDTTEVTLQNLWDKGEQVLAFYHSSVSLGSQHVWPGDAIPSPWPNTTSRSTMIKFLDYHLTHQRPSNSFYVSQGILTPDLTFVIKHLFQSLKSQLASKAGPTFVEWVCRKSVGNPGINVCILDFVEMDEYIDTVINLNNSIPSF